MDSRNSFRCLLNHGTRVLDKRQGYHCCGISTLNRGKAGRLKGNIVAHAWWGYLIGSEGMLISTRETSLLGANCSISNDPANNVHIQHPVAKQINNTRVNTLPRSEPPLNPTYEIASMRKTNNNSKLGLITALCTAW